MSTRRISERHVTALVLVLLPLVYFFPAVIGRVVLDGGRCSHLLLLHASRFC